MTMTMRWVALALLVAAASSFSYVSPRVLGVTRSAVRRVSMRMSEEPVEVVTDEVAEEADAPVLADDDLTMVADDLSVGGDDSPAANEGEDCKLFIGNLNFITEDSDLARVFGEHGEVLSAEHVTERYDPMRKRGFGFVTFADRTGAEAAYNALNGAQVDGRVIRVDFYSNKPPPREKNQQRERRGRNSDDGRRIYVGNLDYGTTDDTLYEIFREYGEVLSCAQMVDREDPTRKRGFGFVTFARIDDANAAVDNLDGLEVDGRPLRVNIAQPRPERY